MQTKTIEHDRTRVLSEIRRLANKMRYGWDFRLFVLGILYYRFISEILCSYVNEKEKRAGNNNFNFSALSDKEAELVRDQIREEKGFFIFPSELFENFRNMVAEDKNPHETLFSILKNIEASAQDTKYEKSLAGLFDFLNLDRRISDSILTRLLNAIGDLPIGNSKVNSIEHYGEAIELLMRIFASTSGSEFYIPQEVSELLVRIAVVGKSSVDKVYDPTCGSGLLLLKFVDVLGKENIRNGLFGQEINSKSHNLCRINFLLNDINFNQFDIALGDTLTKPHHRVEQPFEAIVSNPPYSNSWEGGDSKKLKNDKRFSPAGVLAPRTMSDWAFVMHSLAWLDSNGTAATLAYPGAMYRNGPEMRIRKYLVESNFVDAVIHLPTHLFYGTANAKCILVMKKNKTDNKVLFIDASDEFVRKSGMNKLDHDHLQKILDCFTNREDCAHFSRLVGPEEIASNDFNLSVNSYIEPEIYGEIFDISDLNDDIEAMVSHQSKLRNQIKASIVSLEGGFE